MIKLRYISIKFWLYLVLIIFLWSCGEKNEQATRHYAPNLRVVTTVAPITSIVENIAGDRIRLTGLIPEGMNSHIFEPIPSDIELIANADLIVLNGLDLEVPTLKLAKANKKRRASILMLGNKTITDKGYLYDFSFPKKKKQPNPHLWLNPVYVMKYVELIRDELIRLDSPNQDFYRLNSTLYLERLGALDRGIIKAVKTIAPSNRRLLTYHDSWPYFAQRFGFKVIGAIQPSDFSDPSPREVARIIDQIRIEKVPAVFGAEVFPSPVLKQIAREAKINYVYKLRDDDLPGNFRDSQHSYIGMMLYNIRIMFSALGGSTEALNEIDPTPVAGFHADYRVQE